MKKLIVVMLLFSVFINVIHPYFIHHTDHQTELKEYVVEVSQPVEHGDLCDFHHLFHLSAIFENFQIQLGYFYKKTPINYHDKLYKLKIIILLFKPPKA